MKRTSILIVLLLAAALTFACGGEKKEESPMTQQPPQQTQQGAVMTGFDWESLPLFPGAMETNARMMPGNRGYSGFEIRIFSSPENTKKIVDYYTQEMPENWTFAEETKLDNGLQERWESTTGGATLWIRVTKSKTGEGNDIEIIHGKKQ